MSTLNTAIYAGDCLNPSTSVPIRRHSGIGFFSTIILGTLSHRSRTRRLRARVGQQTGDFVFNNPTKAKQTRLRTD